MDAQIPPEIGENPYYRVSELQLSRLVAQDQHTYNQNSGPKPQTRYINNTPTARATGNPTRVTQGVAVDSPGNAALGVQPGQVGGDGMEAIGSSGKQANPYAGMAQGFVSDLGKAGSDYATANSNAKAAAGKGIYLQEPESREPVLVNLEAPQLPSRQSPRSYYA